jgi:hypothetical protein
VRLERGRVRLSVEVQTDATAVSDMRTVQFKLCALLPVPGATREPAVLQQGGPKQGRQLALPRIRRHQLPLQEARRLHTRRVYECRDAGTVKVGRICGGPGPRDVPLVGLMFKSGSSKLPTQVLRT